MKIRDCKLELFNIFIIYMIFNNYQSLHKILLETI